MLREKSGFITDNVNNNNIDMSDNSIMMMKSYRNNNYNNRLKILTESDLN